MRILITGGFGFLGGRLAAHLAHAGHQILLGSRRPQNQPAWVPRASVVQIFWNDEEALKKLVVDIDVVIHTAGMNAADCKADPVAALEFNGESTARLVNAASMTGVKRFLYFSTAHVYSSELSGVIDEQRPTENSHPYATSHLAGEKSVLAANRGRQFEGSVLRISNAFGAPAHRDVNCWSLLINGLCRQLVESRQMTLRSTGLQQRDFIDITALCNVIEEFIKFDFDARIPEIINIGLGISLSIREISKIIQERCHLVLGFSPPLTWLQADATGEPCLLEFRSNGLRAMNIIQKRNGIIPEIDNLLKFCANNFCANNNA